jgi:hypothetical protein
MPNSTTNIYLNNVLGFNTPRWSPDGDPPALPGDISVSLPNEELYTPEGATEPGSQIPREPFDNEYLELFWETFFEVGFPSVKQDDFNNQFSLGTAGGYYRQLFGIAAKDFYNSYVRGRDDFGSNAQGEILSATGWNQMDTNGKKLAIAQYLYTRGEINSYTASLHLGNFTERTNNIFFWVGRLLINLMTSMQENTINAGRYATELAQVQKSIASEMTNSIYNYQCVPDFFRYDIISLNENNAKKLEDFRALRAAVQKETDQASTFLETSNSGVEQQGNIAMEMIGKAIDLTEVIFRGM